MRFETVLASLLVLSGLACLAMSGTFFSGINAEQYIRTFIQVCIWMGIPILISGIVYFIFIRRKKGD